MTSSLAWMGAVQMTALPQNPDVLTGSALDVLDALDSARNITGIELLGLAYGGKWY